MSSRVEMIPPIAPKTPSCKYSSSVNVSSALVEEEDGEAEGIAVEDDVPAAGCKVKLATEAVKPEEAVIGDAS